MIRSFQHSRLERFFRTGSKAGIQPKHAGRLRIQLSAPDIASRPEDMQAPGWQWHALKADLSGHYAVPVNGNWRLTFRFEGRDAISVNDQDYH